MFKRHWHLLVIILLASLLRLYRLDSFPAGLYWEEVALGYDAYSILKTGMDHHGNSWPIVAFPSFGDYKPSGYFYAAVPFIAAFGLNEWGVRLPSAFAGILTVFLVYLLAIELSNNKRVGLWSAFILAIVPWHVQFSRAAFEANLATMWLVAGVWLLLKARKNNRWFLLGVLPLTFALYTYHSARVTVPLIVITVVVLFFKHYGWRYLLASFLLAVGLGWPIIAAFNTPVVTQRFAETSYFAHTDVVELTNLWREEDSNNLLSRVVHHRYWLWGKEILSGILSHLNPLFLFIQGDKNPRHQTGYFALLFWWMIFPLLFGIKKLTEDSNKKSGLLLLFWFLAAGLAPALTNLAPHTLRFLLAVPVFTLLMGYGMTLLHDFYTSLKRSKGILWAILGVITLTQLTYLYDYYGRYTNKESHEWQYAYKELMHLIESRGEQDPQVYITSSYGRPAMYALFYLHYPPHIIQTMRPILQVSQMELLEFDKFQFVDPERVLDGLVVTEKTYHRGTLIKQIKFLDDRVGFYVYEI